MKKMTKEERLKFFINNYEIIAGGFYGYGPKKYIGEKDKNKRKCRFCGRSVPKTTFRNIAHAIPEFLGNKQLILLDECDKCNEFFSNNIEDHLDKFTKPYRLIGQIKGKTKIPSYKDNSKKSRIDFNNGLKIKTPVNSDFIKDTGDSLIINFKSEPFIPAGVYKGLVKMAISIIENEKELDAFSITIKWLLEADFSKLMIHPLKIWTTFIPGPRPIPATISVLLRRKLNILNVPYSIYIFGFSNFIYQIIIPSHFDANSGETLNISLPFFPSPFEAKDWPYGELKYGLVDVSDTEKVTKALPIEMHYEKKIKMD